MAEDLAVADWLCGADAPNKAQKKVVLGPVALEWQCQNGKPGRSFQSQATSQTTDLFISPYK
jgi:hypothetical protein